MRTRRAFLTAWPALLALGTAAQTEPNITQWLINTTGIMGRHYVSGNPTPIL